MAEAGASRLTFLCHDWPRQRHKTAAIVANVRASSASAQGCASAPRAEVDGKPFSTPFPSNPRPRSFHDSIICPRSETQSNHREDTSNLYDENSEEIQAWAVKAIEICLLVSKPMTCSSQNISNASR